MNNRNRATRSAISKQFVAGGTISNFTGNQPQNLFQNPIKKETNQPSAPVPASLKPVLQQQPIKPAAPQVPIGATNNIQVPINDVPLKPTVKPAVQPMEQQSQDGDTTSENGQKRRYSRQPIPKKIKRLRRNRRLRKILTPKNALMSLHELMGNELSDFNIMPEECGFVATVFLNNVQYEGRGISKMAAKNNASEKALRDIIIQKMIQSPKMAAPKLNAEGTQPAPMVQDDNFHEDIDMVDAENDDNDEGEVPMMHLASFALHKLFSEWQSEGFEIPDFKAGAGPGIPALEIDKPSKKPPGVPPMRTTVPENAESMHPTTLLCMMRPAIKYVDLGSEGQVPNILHRVGVEVDGNHFVGTAKNKKLARKFSALEACNKLFGTNFIKEEN